MVLVRHHEGYRRAYLARGGLVLAACLISVAAASQPPAPGGREASNPPQQIPSYNAPKAKPDQHDAEKAPFVVQATLPPKGEREATQDSQDRQEKAASDWWIVRLTGALAGIGAIQALVFWMQAGRLKETIVKMDEIARLQTEDMKNSIAATERNAAAALQAAKSVSRQVEIMARQVELQVSTQRAFISVAECEQTPFFDVGNQRIGAELMIIVKNSGGTAAFNVWHSVAARIFPNPMPDDFAFPLDEKHGANYGSIGINSTIMLGPAKISHQAGAMIGRINAYIWGRVEYDIFDPSTTRRFLRFCFTASLNNPRLITLDQAHFERVDWSYEPPMYRIQANYFGNESN